MVGWSALFPPRGSFRTTVGAARTVAGIANTADGTDSGGALTSNTVKFGAAPDEAAPRA